MSNDPTLTDVLTAIQTLSAKIDGVETRLDDKINNLKSNMDAKFHAVEHRFSDVEIKIESTRIDLKNDIAAAQSGNIKLFNALRTDIAEAQDHPHG